MPTNPHAENCGCPDLRRVDQNLPRELHDIGRTEALADPGVRQRLADLGQEIPDSGARK
jgi:hypothetical protein